MVGTWKRGRSLTIVRGDRQGDVDMWLAYNQGLDAAKSRIPESSTPTTPPVVRGGTLKPRVLAKPHRNMAISMG